MFLFYFLTPTGTSDHTKPRSTSEPSKRSGIPVKSTKPPPEDPSQDQDLQRHVSTDSLEENFLELDRNLNDLLKKDDRRERALRNGSAHVEEWLKQTSKDAIVPEMLGESLDVVPPQPPLSPTFTENSTSFSQTVSTDNYYCYNILGYRWIHLAVSIFLRAPRFLRGDWETFHV